MLKRAFIWAAVLSLLNLPFALVANGPDDKNPLDDIQEAVPPCAPKKPAPPLPAKAHALKVVPVDFGPWCSENFVWDITWAWGLAPLNTPHVEVRAREHSMFAVKTEETCLLNLEDRNWDDLPSLQHIERLTYFGEAELPDPWEWDTGFFSHFPNLNTLTVHDTSLPPASTLNAEKIVFLEATFDIQHPERLASLPQFTNLRAVVLSGLKISMRYVRTEASRFLAPLASLDKLQALQLRYPIACFFDEERDDLARVVQNAPNLKEIHLSFQGDYFIRNSEVRTRVCVENVLQGANLRHVKLLHCALPTLANLGTEHLESLTMEYCGDIVEGFRETPHKLRKLRLDHTHVENDALETFPLECLERLALYHPKSLAVLSRATQLKHLELAKNKSLHTPLICLEHLDTVPLNANLKILLHISSQDVDFLKGPLQRQPDLSKHIELFYLGLVRTLDEFFARKDERAKAAQRSACFSPQKAKPASLQ